MKAMVHARWAFLLLVSLVLFPSVSFSEEGVATSETAAPAAPAAEDSAPVTPTEVPAVPETPAASEPVAPEPAPIAPPALKPITITFSGELSTVSATDTPPMITVQDRYGVKKEISVPPEAKIAQGTAAKSVSDLKPGDKLTVEYSYDVATGKRTAQSISIGEAGPAAP